MTQQIERPIALTVSQEALSKAHAANFYFDKIQAENESIPAIEALLVSLPANHAAAVALQHEVARREVERDRHQQDFLKRVEQTALLIQS